MSRNCALAHAARAQRDLRRADVGGLRQDIARRQRGGHVLGFMDGVFADLVALADREDLVQARMVWSSQRQREGEDLEHRTQFVDILGHDVAGGIAVAEAARWLGSKSGSETMASTSPVLHVHHDAAGGAGAEGLARLFDFMRQDILHAHVDGGGDRAAGMRRADLVLQPQLQAGDAVVVGIGDAQHLGGVAAVGIVALGAGLEFQARQAQMHHPASAIRRRSAARPAHRDAWRCRSRLRRRRSSAPVAAARSCAASALSQKTCGRA